MNYLNRGDSDAKKHDAVAAEKICLIPQIVSQPKSRAGKVTADTIIISESEAKSFFQWKFQNGGQPLFFVTWYTSEDDIGKQVNSPQDLQEIVKNISSLEGKIITQGERYYVLAGGAAYWMHENKYLICASNWLNYHSDEELLLLAEDITFEKYKIK